MFVGTAQSAEKEKPLADTPSFARIGSDFIQRLFEATQARGRCSKEGYEAHDLPETASQPSSAKSAAADTFGLKGS